MTYHHGDLRRVLLDNAFQMIKEQGVSKLSLRALARQAGVSHAAPGRHFADKASLMTALATESVKKMGEYLAAAYQETEGSAVDRNRALGRAFVRFAVENPAHYMVQIQPDLFHRGDSDFIAAANALTGTLSTAVEELQAEGIFSQHDPAMVVAMYMSVVTGVTALWLDGFLEHVVGTVDPEEAMGTISTIVVPDAVKNDVG
jgi:AcrR family transcriptional regulator